MRQPPEKDANGFANSSTAKPRPPSATFTRVSRSYPPRCSNAVCTSPYSFSTAVSPASRRASSAFIFASSSQNPGTPRIAYSSSVSSGVSGSGFCRVDPIVGFSSITSSPWSVESSPRMILKSVDLPDPLGPTTPTRSPLFTRKLTFVRTSWSP